MLVLTHSARNRISTQRHPRATLGSRAEIAVASTQTGAAVPFNTQVPILQPADATLLVKEIAAEDWDTAIMCGGDTAEYEGQTDGARHVHRFFTELHGHGKPVAAICSGGVVLADTGLLRGQEATCWPDRRQRLVDNNVTFVDRPVVVTGRIVTGRDPQSAKMLVDRLLALVEATTPESGKEQLFPRWRKGLRK